MALKVRVSQLPPAHRRLSRRATPVRTTSLLRHAHTLEMAHERVPLVVRPAVAGITGALRA